MHSAIQPATHAGIKHEPIVVVGHRNPDNDSISSAVAYAHLKNQLDPENNYIPYRLGPLPHESEYVLDRYGISHPEVLTHIHCRVRDVMTANPLQIAEDATMREAGEKLKAHNIRTLIVHDESGQYRGIIDTTTFANLYLSELDDVDATVQTRFTTLARPVRDFLYHESMVLDCEDILNEAREQVLASTLRQAVVLDDAQRAIGIVTRTDLAHTPRRRIVLVDHNEASQAVSGIGEAEVVGIVDHHRIGDIQTTTPIQFVNLPYGSTASIVALEYERYNVALEPKYAAILLSALLTDTVLLKSPTTTPNDHKIAEKLAAIAGLDINTFGRELFEARFAGQDGSVESIVLADSKVFTQGDANFMISAYETVNTESILEKEAEIVAFLDDMVKRNGYEFALALITDIMKEGSQFIIAGRTKHVEHSFGISFGEKHSVWVPGILSRKKQVVPRLML
jgi:manganese-dependent inorganic pyrophosphatase